MQSKVAVSQYRTLIRLAKYENLELLSVSQRLNRGAVKALCPRKVFAANEIRKQMPPQYIMQLVRASFRAERGVTDPDYQLDCLDRGFDAINFLCRVSKQFRKVAKKQKDKSGVLLAVGQVVTNTQDNYRGVIVGWDKTCKRGDKWMRTHNVYSLAKGPGQPFYTVLPDNTDCRTAFGSSMPQAYVPQENLIVVDSSGKSRIQNPGIVRNFSGFCRESNRYIPNAKLRSQFPDDYSVPGAVMSVERRQGVPRGEKK
eukprot:530348_1